MTTPTTPTIQRDDAAECRAAFEEWYKNSFWYEDKPKASLHSAASS